MEIPIQEIGGQAGPELRGRVSWSWPLGSGLSLAPVLCQSSCGFHSHKTLETIRLSHPSSLCLPWALNVHFLTREAQLPPPVSWIHHDVMASCIPADIAIAGHRMIKQCNARRSGHRAGASLCLPGGRRFHCYFPLLVKDTRARAITSMYSHSL